MSDAQIFQVLGLGHVAMGLGILVNSSTYRRVVAEYARNHAIVFLVGVAALVIGFLLVSAHPIWEANRTALLTLIGYAALVKGLWILTLPHQAMRMAAWWAGRRRLASQHGFAVAALGALLLWFGGSAL